MPLDNILKIMEKVSDFTEYHHRLPNILIMGRKLEREMVEKLNPITLISDLRRINGLINIYGNKMFEIVAFTDDIEGFVVMYNTLR